jgi:hypothetical protein
MEKTTVEKFSRKDRDFLIVNWVKDGGSIHQETFEIKKISEQDLFNILENDALMDIPLQTEPPFRAN